MLGYSGAAMQKIAGLIAVLLFGCASRTSPVQPPVSAAYDPSRNDPKATAIAERMIASLGGKKAWQSVRQLRWDVEVSVNGEAKALYSHAWDRWNARHRLEIANIPQESAARFGLTGVRTFLVVYPLFERGLGRAFLNGRPVPEPGRKPAIDNAFARWWADVNMLALPLRTTEPGVYLELAGHGSQEHCPESCDVLAITFDPALGTDRYWLHISRKSYRPHVVEIEAANRTGRIAYRVTSWVEAAGLSFPAALDNVEARRAGNEEQWRFAAIRVGAPDDDLYRVPAR
jgi:hypothetical protein